MALPVAILTYDATPIPFEDIAGEPEVIFDASTSSVGDGASIVSAAFYLLSKPPGSAASLVVDGLEATLTDIDMPGAYRVFCTVTNNIGQVSFAFPVPQQDGTSPYAFKMPALSSFGVVHVTTQYLALTKVAPGERDWLSVGLWPLVDELDQLAGAFATLEAGFGAHTIASHDTSATGAQLDTLTGGDTTDASALHTHATIPATSIGTLTTANILSPSVPGVGFIMDGSDLQARGNLMTRVGHANLTTQGRTPATLVTAWVNNPTTVDDTEELLGTFALPANALSVEGTVLRIRAYVVAPATAGANNTSFRIEIGGQNVFVWSSKGAFPAAPANVDVVAKSSSAQYCAGNLNLPAINTTLDMSTVKTVSFYGYGNLAGDVTLLGFSAEVLAT